MDWVWKSLAGIWQEFYQNFLWRYHLRIYIESNTQAVKLKLLKSVSEYHRCTMHCYPLASKIGNYGFQLIFLLIPGSHFFKGSVYLPHQVSQEKLLQYIHFNRHHNTILIEHNTKLINQLRTEMEAVKAIQGQSTKISLSLSRCSGNAGEKGGWQPCRLLWQDLCWIPEGILSQRCAEETIKLHL